MFSRLTRFVLAHKGIVALVWLAIAVAGMATSATTTNRLSTQFSVPGREGFDTSDRITAAYGNGGLQLPVVPVVTLPAGTTVDSPGVRDQLAALDSRLLRATAAQNGSNSVRVASYASTGNQLFVSHDRRTTYSMVFVPLDGIKIPVQEETVRGIVNGSTIAGAPVRLTGYQELAAAPGSDNGGPGVLVEALLGGAGAMLVLAFVFASFIALVPLVVAIVAIMGTFLVILGLTAVAEVSFIVEFLVALIGLGVAIDYSLLVVTRWREEKANGLSGDAAVQRAMETAGRAVVFSGTTVAIGLLALVVLPVPFLRSVGYAGMLIPLMSVLVSLTLLPVMLAVQGTRRSWPWRTPVRRSILGVAVWPLLFVPRLVAAAFVRLDWPRIRREAHASRGWVAWGRTVVRRRWIAAGAAVLVLGALLVPAAHLSVGYSQPDSLAQSGPALQGLRMLERSGIGSGPLLPYELLVERGDPGGVATATAQVHDMYGAVAPSSDGWSRGGTSVVTAVSTLPGDTSAGRAQVDHVRDAVRGTGATVGVGGSSPQSADFVSAVYGNFPLMLSLVVFITFILLARAFRSLLLPLKAVVLNVLSVAASYGIMVLVWQDGHGSSQLFGIQATGTIDPWIPLMSFAFLFGLSMDYEVFILARMREEYDRTGSTNLAVVRAIGRTGRLVTCAALILFLAFVSLASGPQTTIKVFATGLAAGIVLDATIVRALLVPALVSLFGQWNWWLPAWAARLLRVPASHSLGRETVPAAAAVQEAA